MVVRMRSNRSHTGNRRAHHALVNPAMSRDAKGAVHIRHRATKVTGIYKNHTAIDVAKRLARREKKIKAENAAAGK